MGCTHFWCSTDEQLQILIFLATTICVCPIRILPILVVVDTSGLGMSYDTNDIAAVVVDKDPRPKDLVIGAVVVATPFSC